MKHPSTSRRTVWGAGLCAAVSLWLTPSPAAATDPTLPAPAPSGPFTLGTVQVDPQARTVTATGWVNQVSGLVELLACGPQGRTHESVFVLGVNPMDLQTALLLLGLKPGTPPRALGEGAPQGPPVDIWVEWRDAQQQPRRERGERFIYNEEQKRVLPTTGWIFTGSKIEGGEFVAQSDQSLVRTLWDPYAILNLPLSCGTNDDILFVNEKLVPPLGTAVSLRFTPQSPRPPWWRRLFAR